MERGNTFAQNLRAYYRLGVETHEEDRNRDKEREREIAKSYK